MIGLLNFDKLKFQSQDLSGKVAVVTGANVGLGLETVRQLIKLNCKVYLLCRNKAKGLGAITKLKLESEGADLHLLLVDLEDLDSIHRVANQLLQLEIKLDILINNAGLFSESRIITKDNLERTLQCNYFGPVLLTLLLLPLLKKAEQSRVVSVSSAAYKYGTYDLASLTGTDTNKSYSMMSAYNTSKLYLNLFHLALHHILNKDQTKVFLATTHPGLVATDIAQKPGLKKGFFNKLFFHLWNLIEILIARTPAQGAITTLHATVDPNIPMEESGNYWVNCRVQKLPAHLSDSKLTTLLFENTLQVLNFDSSLL